MPDNQLMKATVPAGGMLKVPVHVLQLNSLLQWYFTVSTGDIDFKITYGEKEEEVWFIVNSDKIYCFFLFGNLFERNFFRIRIYN